MFFPDYFYNSSVCVTNILQRQYEEQQQKIRLIIHVSSRNSVVRMIDLRKTVLHKHVAVID